jgi:uncharacterized protein DUF6508
LPRVSLSAEAYAFEQAAYAFGWVEWEKFDWPQWKGTAEAKQLRDDPGVLARATPEQLAKLLTVCIRQDRFSEGTLQAAFETGCKGHPGRDRAEHRIFAIIHSRVRAFVGILVHRAASH